MVREDGSVKFNGNKFIGHSLQTQRKLVEAFVAASLRAGHTYD
jgi:hypothetical protein